MADQIDIPENFTADFSDEPIESTAPGPTNPAHAELPHDLGDASTEEERAAAAAAADPNAGKDGFEDLEDEIDPNALPEEKDDEDEGNRNPENLKKALHKERIEKKTFRDRATAAEARTKELERALETAKVTPPPAATPDAVARIQEDPKLKEWGQQIAFLEKQRGESDEQFGARLKSAGITTQEEYANISARLHGAYEARSQTLAANVEIENRAKAATAAADIERSKREIEDNFSRSIKDSKIPGIDKLSQRFANHQGAHFHPEISLGVKLARDPASLVAAISSDRKVFDEVAAMGKGKAGPTYSDLVRLGEIAAEFRFKHADKLPAQTKTSEPAPNRTPSATRPPRASQGAPTDWDLDPETWYERARQGKAEDPFNLLRRK